MGQLVWPSGAKTVEVTHELWSPNQIVIPLLSGDEERIHWTPPRWRGTFTLALADRGDDADALELFVAEFSTGSDWVAMPWPKRTPLTQMAGTRAASGTWTITGAASPSTAPGRWLRIGSRLHQIRTVSGDLKTPGAARLTLLPDVAYTGAQTLWPALTAHVRCQQPTPIDVRADRYHSGPVTFPWVEKLDG